MEQILPSWPSKGSNPANTWILDFWTPELCDKTFLFLKPPSLWYLVAAAIAHKYSWPVLAPSLFFPSGEGGEEKIRILKTLQSKMGFFWYNTWKPQQCLHK